MSELFELAISDLAYGGEGVGRYDGKVVFVPFTAPGDLILCEMEVSKKRFSRGKVSRIIRGSEMRIEPRCPYYGRCGGCQLQHLNYPFQVQWKRRVVKDALKRYGGVERASVKSVAGSEDFGYRGRLRFSCTGHGNSFRAGFMAAGSNEVVDIDSCPVASSGINRVWSALREKMPYLGRAIRPVSVEVCEGVDGRARALVVVRKMTWPSDSVLDVLKDIMSDQDASLFIKQKNGKCAGIAGDGRLCVYIGSMAPAGIWYGPEGFAQINHVQNKNLVEAVIEACGGDISGKRILDLFCGMGNFSIPLAMQGGEVTGVEGSGKSVKMAVENAERNSVSIRFVASDCREFARAATGNQEKYDIVILDPPRRGASGIMPAVAALEADTVIYVSCDPYTLCRDARELVKYGYVNVCSRVFDMFPQSYHMETLNLFHRRV